MCLVTYGVSPDSFSEKEMMKNSTTSNLIQAAYSSNVAIQTLETGFRLWKYFDTPTYKKLCKSQSIIEE